MVGKRNKDQEKMLSKKSSEKSKRPVDASDDAAAPKKKFKDGKSEGSGKKVFKGDYKKKFGGKNFEKPQPEGKPNWNELKTKKRDLKIQRKKNKVKDLYEISVQAKKLYEELKQ